MNKKNALACTLSMLAVALLLLVPFAFLLGPSDVTFSNDTEAGTVHYSYENLFKSDTVFNERAISYPLDSLSDIRDMATGDLNNDGIIDVAVATGTGITILYGIGNGALGSSFTLPVTMSDARKMAVGDLDNDGKADIAATYIDPSDGFPRVGIFYQKNAFTTTANLQIQAYDDPWQVVIGDFSNSGTNGLAVICRGNPGNGDPATLMLLRSPYINLADKKYIELSGLDNLKLLAAGHVNADGRLDLVAGDAYGNSVIVLTQPASFSISWSPVTLDLGGSIADILFMDYLNDGTKNDLVVAKYGVDSNQIEVRLNTGSIPASASHLFTFNGASSLGVGGVTSVNSQDLIVLSGSDNAVKLYPHQSGGLDSGAYFQFPVNSGPIKAAPVSNGIYVLSSGSAVAKPTIEYYRYSDTSMRNADGNRFVSDGQPTVVCCGDVSFGVIAAVYDGQNAVYVSTLSGASRVITTSSVPTSLYIGDLDGDGIGDLAISFRSSNSVSIYKGSSSFMSNNAPVTISLPSPLSQPQSLIGGRIPAIGTNILVVGCRGGIDVIYNPLSGSPTHETIGTGYSGDRIDMGFGAIDPSGTGFSIASLNSNTGRVEIYHLKQSATIGDSYDVTYSAWLSIPGFTPNSMTIGDFDGNGRDDVAVTTTSNQLKVFSNTGTGFVSGTQPSNSITLPGAAGQVRSGDLNDDGKDDLVVRYSSIAEIGIWLSKESMTFSNPFDLTAGGIAGGIWVNDVNGDRRDDIVASSPTSDALSYWLQRNLAPSASVWHSSFPKYMNSDVIFDASNTTDSASDTLTYYWDFGDGQTSTLMKTQHQYVRNGSFSGSLRVTDRSGGTDLVTFVVQIFDPLVASFSVTNLNPYTNQNIYVSWNSNNISSDQIASLTWNLGDGRNKSNEKEFFVNYSNTGSYDITLTLVDTLGTKATSKQTIIVSLEKPIVEGLVANGGQTSFLMDEPINFEVLSLNASSVNGYSWDMDFNGTFNPVPGITRNQTSWSYSTPGEHTVVVSNPYLSEFPDQKLTIFIGNVRPIADISSTSTSMGNFTFDASKSTDTSSDMQYGLSYRWNFGDGEGWTIWSNSTQMVKNYTIENTYTVFLEVKDRWDWVGNATFLAIVDASPPVIDLDNSSLVAQAYRGEDLIIKVNVTDASSVKEVLLIYTSNNETKTLVMSRISGTNTYVATIPAKDVTGDLSYYIDAVDNDGRHSVTATMTISLTDRPDNFWMYLVLVVAAALGAIFLLYYRTKAMVVDDVFIIYHDGNLMAHQTRRLKPGMDDQILGSMLVAIQDFVRDSFKDEASTGLNRMDFGDQKVLVEKGEHIYLAVVLHGQHEGRVPQRMKEAISRAESNYSQALEGWDGDLEKVRGIKDETDPLLKSTLKDIVSSIPFMGHESAGPTEMTACPQCGTTYSSAETKCPKCGTEVERSPSDGESKDAGGPAA